MTSPSTGHAGVFTSLTRANLSGLAETAAAAESAGFDALWLADVRGELAFLETCLAATTRLSVGSAVLSMWDIEPEAAAEAWQRADKVGPGRAVLGVGASHPTLAARAGHTYDRPLTRLAAFLDGLDEAGVPTAGRILGANGPKMVALAGKRSLGAITQMVTPERTREQREQVGPDAVLATEVKVVVGGSSSDARALGRANLAHYLGMPSYQRNLLSLGFEEADLVDGGSDRLVDALVTGPDPASIRARITEQRDAGADHVCLHVLHAGSDAPLSQWQRLAEITHA